ncbi:39S mitochondrial ribosomal protein L46 family protein [Acanthocheilonema viteae]
MRHRVLNQISRLHSSLASSSEGSHVWDIFASVALIRPPIIAPPMSDIEKRYHDFMLQRELENSLRCDFELRQLRDERLLKERERLKMIGEEANLQEEIGILASVDEENWRKQADRIREQLAIGDLTKFSKADSKSLQRKIDEFLVLIVCQKFGRKDGYHSPWHLPQLQNLPGESLKQTSERCLKELFTTEVYGKGISNAPFSVYFYCYPVKLRQRLKTQSRGAAVFFFKALYMNRVSLMVNEDEVADYKWVNAEEFAASMKHKISYLRAVSTLFPSYLLARNNFEYVK